MLIMNRLFNQQDEEPEAKRPRVETMSDEEEEEEEMVS